MKKNHVMTGCIIAGVVGLVAVVAFDVRPAFLLVLLVCPLMMVLMMRAMMSSPLNSGQQDQPEAKSTAEPESTNTSK